MKNLLRLVVVLLCIAPLTGCVNLKVPDQFFDNPECINEVIPPGNRGDRLTDNQIAELIERLDARGDICAAQLEELRAWLKTKRALRSTT